MNKRRKMIVYRRISRFLLMYLVASSAFVLVIMFTPVVEEPVRASIPVFDYGHSLPKFEVKVPEIISKVEVQEVKTPHPTLEIQEMTTSEVVYIARVSEVNNKELDLLARCINAEARGESYDAKLAVGSVILNRVDSGQFPNSIKEVIYQKNQFSVVTTWDKQINNYMIERQAGSDSIEIAKYLLEKGSVIPKDVLVFYGDYCTEKWTTSRRTYKQIDNTVFAYVYK